MRRNIVSVFVCMLLLATAFPAMGTIHGGEVLEEQGSAGCEEDATPFYENGHHVGIRMDKVWVYDDSDPPPKGDGEYYFKMYAIPKIWHMTSTVYEAVEDPHPHDFGTIGYFDGVHFTPQVIVIIAMEEDVGKIKDDFLDWIVIVFNPPKGDYKWPDQYEDIITWENTYFKAVVKVYMHYGKSG